MNYGYAVMFTGLAVLAGVYVYDLVRAGKLRRLVFANLDAADDSCCFNSVDDNDGDSAGYLYGMTAAEVANDMTLYCEDASGYSEDELLPYVEAWMLKNGIAT